jgi:hypothetical protein
MAVMEPWHAASLALIGWYLMMPPVQDYGAPPKTPLSQWDQAGAFDTAAACEAGLADLWDCGQDLQNNDKGGTVKEACEKIAKSKTLFVKLDTPGNSGKEKLVYQLTNVRCIATDDPRLSAWHFQWPW